MRPDGRGLRRVTENRPRYSHPVWSPDGRYIAVVGADDDNQGLYVMRPDGRGLRKILDGRRTLSSSGEPQEWEVLGGPSWQPLRR
jgi:Tol biopolymer transport system component